MNEVNLEKPVRRSFSEGGLPPDARSLERRLPAVALAKEGCTNKLILISYHPKKMHYTYILKSISHPSQIYIGFTANLKQRLIDHNSGKSPHTNKFKPWNLDFYCAFNTEEKAINFEKYLKSGSGRSL
jgi:putative endonuclease